MDYEYYMKQALRLAEKALAAKEFPVGCVLVYEDRIIAEGFRRHSTGRFSNEIDHAEITALRKLSGSLQDMDASRITVFSTMEPCLMCFGCILINGIGKIVYGYEDAMGGATSCDLSALGSLYRDRSITIVPNILREESLDLFKRFFREPENSYWKESLLARYTLNQ
ncbi:MAG: nucleoside deaminase [Desulfobacterales bacterium]